MLQQIKLQKNHKQSSLVLQDCYHKGSHPYVIDQWLLRSVQNMFTSSCPWGTYSFINDLRHSQNVVTWISRPSPPTYGCPPLVLMYKRNAKPEIHQLHISQLILDAKKVGHYDKRPTVLLNSKAILSELIRRQHIVCSNLFSVGY